MMAAIRGTCGERTAFFHQRRFKTSAGSAALIAGALIVTSPSIAVSQEAAQEMAPETAQEAPLPLMTFTRSSSSKKHSRRSRRSHHRSASHRSKSKHVEKADKTPGVELPPEKPDVLTADANEGGAPKTNAKKSGAQAWPTQWPTKVDTAAAGSDSAFAAAAGAQNANGTTGSAGNSAGFNALDAAADRQATDATRPAMAEQTVKIVSPDQVNELDLAADKRADQTASNRTANAAQPGEQISTAGATGAMTSVQSSTVIPWLTENSWIGKILLAVAGLAIMLQVGWLLRRRRAA